jgi:hypothetical protein
MKNPFKTVFPLRSLLNLSFKPMKLKILFAIFCFFWMIQSGYALQIYGVYRADCQRELGIFLGVDDVSVQLLNLDGQVQEIPRFNINYIAQYPVGKSVVSQILTQDKVSLISIRTIFENKIVKLLKGWMVDHSENKISFLTIEGVETVIDTNHIWDIDISPQSQDYHFPLETTVPKLVHPYPYRECNKQSNQKSESWTVYPQVLHPDHLSIKKELDRLQKGYRLLSSFYADKMFYPVPQIYNNDTAISIGAYLNSRYGASKYRNSSFVPAVTSEYSEGPYGFQSIWIAGSNPLKGSVHEEPQNQISYRMKSDFIHFSVSYDITRMLIGDEQYHWQEEELKSLDDRWNETGHISFGFDYLNYAIDVALLETQYGIRYHEHFVNKAVMLLRLGLNFQNRFVKTSLFYGSGTSEKDDYDKDRDGDTPEEQAYLDALYLEYQKKPEFKGKFKFYRLNLETDLSNELNLFYSLILRNADYYAEENIVGEGMFNYQSSSITNSVYLNYVFNFEMSMTLFTSLEMIDQEGDNADSSDSGKLNVIKIGTSIALTF